MFCAWFCAWFCGAFLAFVHIVLESADLLESTTAWWNWYTRSFRKRIREIGWRFESFCRRSYPLIDALGPRIKAFDEASFFFGCQSMPPSHPL